MCALFGYLKVGHMRRKLKDEELQKKKDEEASPRCKRGVQRHPDAEDIVWLCKG